MGTHIYDMRGLLPSQYEGSYIKGRWKPLQPLWTPIRPVYWTLGLPNPTNVPLSSPKILQVKTPYLAHGWPYTTNWNRYMTMQWGPLRPKSTPPNKTIGGPCTTIIKTESIMSFEHHRSSSSGTYPYITLCIFNVRTITLLQ
jgi:hypothetical protein